MLAGKHTWIERGSTPLPYSIDDLRPKPMDEILGECEEMKAPEAEKPAREELRIA